MRLDTYTGARVDPLVTSEMLNVGTKLLVEEVGYIKGTDCRSLVRSIFEAMYEELEKSC